jgi:hypothetical protein
MGAPCCQRAGWPAKSSSSHNSLLGPPLALPNAIFPSLQTFTRIFGYPS